MALALLGVVGAALLRALDRQARFHTGIVRLVETHAQLAITHDALAAELRAVASPHDLLRLGDTAVVYRTVVGTAIACAVGPGTVDLVPEILAGRGALARLRTAPQPGDSIWLFDEGATLSMGDDAWHLAHVRTAQPVPGACDGTPFVHPVADAGRRAWRLTIDTVPPLPPGVTAGTLVRVTRLARFALYRSATGESSLGWSEWNASSGGWNVIQPLTAPFLPYNNAQPGASGVAFVAADSLGAASVPGPLSSAPARIGVSTRAATAQAIRLDGMPRGRHTDSLRSLIALRNRP